MSELLLRILWAIVYCLLMVLAPILWILSLPILGLHWTLQQIIQLYYRVRRVKLVKAWIQEMSGLLLCLAWVLVSYGLVSAGAYVWQSGLEHLPIFNFAAITFVVGKPRSGKGLLTMRFMMQELRTTQRPIITNFAFELKPWVNGKGLPQVGLLAYLRREFGQTFNAENRIFLLSDDEMSRFFLYRAIPNPDHPGRFIFKQAHCETRRTKDGDIIYGDFDTELLCTPGSACVYLADEAWRYWGSRAWQSTGSGVLFYGAQHGKLGDDWIIATQHTKQVDLALRNFAQDFWQCRNRSYLKMGIFRQPKDIKVYQYENPPTGQAQEAMDSYKFKVDAAGMAQCYDTSKGVGLTGGLGADMNRITKGISWRWIYAFGLGAIFLFWFGLNKGLAFFMKKATPDVVLRQNETPQNTNTFARNVAEYFTPKPKSAGDLELPNVQGVSLELPSQRQLLRSNIPEEVFVIGFGYLGPTKQKVFLSDGRTYQTGDGHLTVLLEDRAIIDGKAYRRGSAHSEQVSSVSIPQRTSVIPY